MTVNYEIGKPRNDRRMRITLILCIGKTKKRIKTELFALMSDLNRKGRLKNDSPIYKKVREMMRTVESEYITLDTFLTGERLTAADALTRMHHTDIPTFFTYAEHWLERAEMKGKKNYLTAIRNFRTFTKGDIPFSAFSHLLICDYLYTLRDRPRAQTLYLSAIKHIYREAEKDYGVTPFSSFRIDQPRQKQSQHRALDVNTIRRIFSYNPPTSRSRLAKDCAILSFCLCGTNSADLFTAPPIKRNILAYDRTKTKDSRQDSAHIEIDIPQQVRELVFEYKGATRAFSFHTRYKDLASFNKHLNIGLKRIQDDLGLERLTFYAFRHSWATIARNDLGIDKGTVNDALNHVDEDMRITDIYIRKSFRQINIANKKVVDYVFNSLGGE